MNQNQQLDVPVLFLTFNRPETTRQVFAQIKKQQPQQLYLASDGPRAGKAGEGDVIHAVRKFLLDEIDWRCEVHTLFRAENLGCGKAPASAISWFFEQVEYGIILEDDCLPSDSFFMYCRELLLKHRDNPNIMHVAGCNPLDISLHGTDSYFFTKIPSCWGWATWRRAWQNFSYEISSESLNKVLRSKNFRNHFPHIEERRYWRRIFTEIKDGELTSAWDYQWVFAIAANSGICATPCRNLISNIGFSEGATHTTNAGAKQSNQLRYEVIEINHPQEVKLDLELCDRISEEQYNIAIRHLFRHYARRFWRDCIWHPAKRLGKKILRKFFPQRFAK